MVLALSAVPALANDSNPLKNFRFYGHFSPAFVGFNDGVDKYGSLVDNAYSGGRIGFWLDLPARRGQLRFNAETSLGLRSSSSVSQGNVPPVIDLNASTLRKFEIIHDTERVGSFSFGLGSMGSDSVTESDLSSTQLAAYVGISDTAGGYSFRTSAGALSAVTLSDAYPTFDGGRAPRIRWDSPDLTLSKLGSFNVAVSVGTEVSDGNLVVNDSLADVGVFYRNKLGQFDLKASAGFSIAETNGTQSPQSAGSVSLLHAPSGLSLTFASGAREGAGQYLYSKVGLKQRWVKWGDTSVSLDLYQGYSTVSNSSRSESLGIGIVQGLDKANLRFYLGLRQYDFDQPGLASYRTSRSIIFGTRWVFRKHRGILRDLGRSEVDWNEAD